MKLPIFGSSAFRVCLVWTNSLWAAFCIHEVRRGKACCYHGRWRKLEGSDPAAYQLVQKVQLLQKRLLRAAEQLVERELQIQQGQATCAQLQAVVSRCPGPEAAQQLSLAKVPFLH